MLPLNVFKIVGNTKIGKHVKSYRSIHCSEGDGEIRKWHKAKKTDRLFNPYPTAFPHGKGMVLHFYQQQESSTTKTVHTVINKGLKAYV